MKKIQIHSLKKDVEKILGKPSKRYWRDAGEVLVYCPKIFLFLDCENGWEFHFDKNNKLTFSMQPLYSK